MGIQKKLKEKWQEALQAVLPIICIVLALCFSIAPVSPSILLCFLMGAVLILAGMMFFTLGAEISMTPMGERVGSSLTKSRNLFLIVILSFLLGLIITISEPDLQVLAGQVPAVPSIILILSVACGVGVFLVIALLRMLFSVPLPPLLIAFYVLIFALSAFVPKDFLSIAFDSGGVTTGPMTVPFIMALGVGVSAIRSDRHAADDSFGLEAAQKVVIFAFVTDSEWKRIKTGLQRQMKIDVPGSGIAFIIPVSSVGGKKQLQFLTEGRDFKKEEESVLKDTRYELLVVIANQGYTEMIMDAAREASAVGGTVIHAKGTGTEKAERFLGVSIAAEKEMIFMVTRREGKNDIMRAIMNQAGLDSRAGAIVFSLPVTDTAGMRLLEDSEE